MEGPYSPGLYPEWQRLTASTLNQLASQDAIVLLPIGSVEQHGLHLPTGLDAMLAAEVCKRSAAIVAAQQPIVVAPTVWCSLADHHVAFGGTFSLTFETFHALLRDLCGSIAKAGFSRITLVNGHGGNVAGLTVIAGELARELALPIATTTYFAEALDEIAAILTDQNGLMHACEGETSMMMAVNPTLVDTNLLPQAHGPSINIVAAQIPTLRRFRPFRDTTTSGVAGDARNATAAKGEAILDACAANLAARLLRGEPWSDLDDHPRREEHT